ncbi:MAG TPA: adenylosuccinate synthetase [Candidatus Bathyarchaeia archaeon]|nr:adenylosuccinate synthetase [Candidatus Bathyarchaeia archaeon]
MVATIIVGGFFGDEGKGKIVAHVAFSDKPTIIARGGVGPNAGHTVEIGNKKFGVRMIPSGFVYKNARVLIGAGVLVDPKVLFRELELLEVRSRIGVDSRCGIIEDRHILMDKKNDHLSKEIGSTGTGCGPAAAERAMRIIKQAKDLPELKDYTTDVPIEINEAINRGDNVLLEGSQGYGLSLFYGTYPYVTSKDTTASQIASDIGVGPTKIDETIVVFKAFPTRVGEGPFKTQMSEEEVRRFKIEEFGTVTGRARRIGLWDQEMAKYSAMINGATQIAVTGLDKLDPTVKGVNDFEKLTQKVKTFVDQNEREIGIPFTLLSTGPDISEIVDLREEKLKRT